MWKRFHLREQNDESHAYASCKNRQKGPREAALQVQEMQNTVHPQGVGNRSETAATSVE